MIIKCFKTCFLSGLIIIIALSFAAALAVSSLSKPSTFAYASENVFTPADFILPVINHPANQEFPDVDGQQVVWQDFRFGPTDIFLADLTTGVITNLTQSPTWEIQPDLDDNVVVWKDGYNGIGIHGLNITTGQIFTVTEGHSDTSRPHLSGNIVVWADNRAGGEDWNIYGYNLDTQTEFIISNAPGRQQDPQIDGNYVVWWDYQEHIYLYNLNTQQTTTILDTAGARLPDVSEADNLVVWQDYRNNGQWDIYGYNLTTQTELPLIIEPEAQENAAIADGLLTYQSQTSGISWNVHLHILAEDLSFPITDNSNPQVFPVVAGNTIVWQDSRNHQPDIYYFSWTGNVPPVISYPLQAPGSLQVGAFPTGQLYLQWQESITNELGFKIERSRGITSAIWQEIATLPPDTTAYTDTPGLMEESYWYRIRAYNNDGFSAYTNDSFNSTFNAVPNLDEQYLMVLLNEARLAPSAFGYPEYTPVPPLAYNPNIAYSARSHSQSILNSGFQFGHCDPIGRCPGERVLAAGYPNRFCGENLTMSNTGPVAMEGVNQGFMNSEGHRNNIMGPDLNEFGLGHTYDLTKGDFWFHGQVTEVFCGREGVIPPVVPMGSVVPYTGTIDTLFTYIVNFYNANGQAPTVAQVVIDNTAYPLSLSTGTAAQGTYRYTTTLSSGGVHSYYFWFEYGTGLTARWPQTGEMNLPNINGSAINYIPLVLKP